MTDLVSENEHEIDVKKYRKSLISWGKDNFRDFPWRNTNNPYFILISEVMLHRTQVKQVLPVYLFFISKYPDIESLSKAQKDELHSILYSLGLKWRIDLMYEMAQMLIEKFRGNIPRNRDDLLSLPGVSEYIANSTRCFSWNFPEPLADTNTIRVTGRLFGLKIKPSSRRNRVFKKLLEQLLSPNQPRDYNYALLDIADKICTKRIEPACSICPIFYFCKYGKTNVVGLNKLAEGGS